MDIYFPEETLKALKKAGVKSEVLISDESYYRGLSIEHEMIEEGDFEIVRKVLARPELSAKIENRRVLRQLEAVEKINQHGRAVKVGTLAAIPEIMKRVVGPTPHKWIFILNHALGTPVPAFVENCEYHEASRDRKASVTLKLLAIVRGHETSFGTSFNGGDVKGTIDDMLAKEGMFIETPELVAAYEKSLAVYRKFCDRTGEQFSGVGRGDIIDGGWSRGTVSLARDGVSAKLVMDDDIKDDDEGRGTGRGKASGFTDTNFWTSGKKRRSLGGEGDEETFPLPVHPIVRVFNLRTHEFLKVHVDSLSEYQYDAKLGEKLVLPTHHRQLVDVLTGGAVHRMSDIVKGKATGVIILCSGKPGTGKTLTAEVYSEVAKRPLYTVQCSQLGVTSDKLEEKLAEVLDRANRWGAILLIDEADVYIHERGSSLDQNAVVGVFLRLLEYYAGILFLTTNRETVVDDAIMSRCTAHIKYDVLKGGARKAEDLRPKLWKTLLAQYGVDLDIGLCIGEFPEVSGRMIRQMIRLAKMMADSNGTSVYSVEQLKWAATFHSE